jgi:hypothetical protein
MVVRDSGAKHFGHPFGKKTPDHPSLVVGMLQNSKVVFPDVFKSSGGGSPNDTRAVV